MTNFGLCATSRPCLVETSSEKDSLPDKTYYKDGNEQSNTTPSTEAQNNWLNFQKKVYSKFLGIKPSLELSPIINRKQHGKDTVLQKKQSD